MMILTMHIAAGACYKKKKKNEVHIIGLIEVRQSLQRSRGSVWRLKIQYNTRLWLGVSYACPTEAIDRYAFDSNKK